MEIKGLNLLPFFPPDFEHYKNTIIASYSVCVAVCVAVCYRN